MGLLEPHGRCRRGDGEADLSLRPALSVALLATLAGLPARADIITACSAEIGRYCADVPEGRGRIAACLIGNEARLGGACRPELRALADRAGRNVMLPGGVRRLLAPDFAADLPASCSGDVARLCADASSGAPTFACLYARGDRVSETCTVDARRATGG